MRFVTARHGAAHRLFVEAGRGLVDVASGGADLQGVVDVGSLLRAGPAALAAAGHVIEGGGEAVAGGVEALDLSSPVVTPSKIICIGLNYRKHAAEGGEAVPGRPILFSKFLNALRGPGDAIVHPTITDSLDYEGELAVVIGQRVASVSVADAGKFVGGYCVANDVSARDLQADDPAGQWLRGKSLDSFAPVGPYFVTSDEVPDWRELHLRTWVNGDLRQDEVCGDMVFGVEELVSFISQGMTLEPGDMILTGTPSGVGYAFDPPRWLRPGDVVEVEISGLGRLKSPVVAQAEVPTGVTA
jgi:2-keto-4-pentenoate hydratase/2-oxohepta-3-ene-1,7-dioic acid hydratase in catechol pathway